MYSFHYFKRLIKKEFQNNNIDCDEDDELTRTIYIAARENVLQRLDVMGFTSDATQLAFENWRSSEQEMHREWVDEGSDWAQAGLEGAIVKCW